MTVRLPVADLSDERIREASLDPDLRDWEAPDGRAWRVRTEAPFVHPGVGESAARKVSALAFYSDEARLETCISADVSLGDLTSDQLHTLLKTAKSFPWD